MMFDGIQKWDLNKKVKGIEIMRIVNNILELIGETPMLKLNLRDSNWNVYLKLEKFNPEEV